MAAAIAYRNATLDPAHRTSASWSLPAITLPTGGNWRFTALAFDTRGQQDPSRGHSGNYAVYPGDGPPTLSETLGQPQSGATLHRRQDRRHRSRRGRPRRLRRASPSVRIGVVNAAGQYMSSTGTFTSTTAELPHGVPQQPGKRRVELLVHDAGHPGRHLHRPGAVRRRPQPAQRQRPGDRRRPAAHRHRGHGHPAGQQPAGRRASPTPATRTSAPSTVAARPTRTPPR